MKIKNGIIVIILCLAFFCLIFNTVSAVEVNNDVANNLRCSSIDSLNNSNYNKEIIDTQNENMGIDDSYSNVNTYIVKSGKNTDKLGNLYVNGEEISESGPSIVTINGNEETLLNFTDPKAQEEYYIQIDENRTKKYNEEILNYLPRDKIYYNNGSFLVSLNLPTAFNMNHIFIGEYDADGKKINNEWGQHIIIMLTKAQSNITLSTEDNIAIIKVSSLSGKAIPNGTVFYTVNGTEYKGITDSNGIIKFNISGIVDVEAKFMENTDYFSSNTSKRLYYLNKTDINMSFIRNIKQVPFSKTLSHENGTVYSFYDLTIRFNKKIYDIGESDRNVTFLLYMESDHDKIIKNETHKINNGIFDSNVFVFTPTEIGRYIIKATFNGDYYYNPTTSYLTFDALPINTTLSKYLDGNGDIIVSFKTINDLNISNATISCFINNMDYFNVTTNDEGKARIDYEKFSNEKGRIDIVLKFSGTEKFNPSSLTDKIFLTSKIYKRVKTIIESENFNQTAVDFHNGELGGYFTVTLKDRYGDVLPYKNIFIGFNGVKYNKTTNNEGIASLQINLQTAGTYTFAVAFLSDRDYEGSFTVNKITITRKESNLILKYNKTGKVNHPQTLTINLQGQNTLNPKKYITSVNKTVKLTVNNKMYSIKIDSKGAGTFKLKFNKIGTYIITTKFTGDNTYSSKTLKSKITIRK